jgi:hypothetical protein
MCGGHIWKRSKDYMKMDPGFWNYHNSEPFQITPRLRVLEFQSFYHIGALMFVRTLYCVLELNRFYGTSVAINCVLEKFWYRGVQNFLWQRDKPSLKVHLQDACVKLTVSETTFYELLLPLITFWKILIQGRPNFFGKPTNRHWRVLLQDACVKLTVIIISIHLKYCITSTV